MQDRVFKIIMIILECFVLITLALIIAKKFF